jgi:heme/copper-type cytochrome/quinol oxidase subunit 2
VKRGALFAATTALSALFAHGSASAATMGQPTPEGVNLQPAATQVMREIHEFHDFLLPIIVVISVFVLALLLWVIVRYNRRANPTPRKFTHNMLVEVIWTVVPVLILVAIAWKSFPLIYTQERIPEAELTLKVTGNSWFWNLEYPDQGVYDRRELAAGRRGARARSSVAVGRRPNRCWCRSTPRPRARDIE